MFFPKIMPPSEPQTTNVTGFSGKKKSYFLLVVLTISSANHFSISIQLKVSVRFPSAQASVNPSLPIVHTAVTRIFHL
jgi:hypothetical protein